MNAPEKSNHSRASWIQVMMAAILMVATFPGRTQGLGLITEPLLADLHLDRLVYANINLWATLFGALFCFPVGWAIDRLGIRKTTLLVLFLLSLSVWRLSAMTAGVVVIFLMLLGTRAFGQSALSVCSITTVGKEFPKRAGFAMAVYSVLVCVLFAIGFGAIGYLVREHGWRFTWQGMALALLFVVAPLAFFVLRKSGVLGTKNSDAQESAGFTLSHALRSPAFWLFAGAAAAFNLVSSGLGLFNEAVLAERGFDQKTYTLFLAGSSLLSLVGQFLCGWQARRVRYQTLTSLAMLLYGVGLALIPVITQRWQLWCLAALLGVAGGMVIVIFFSVWSDLFGQKHLGRIQGAAQMITVVSSGLGPILFASSIQHWGSYSPVLFALAAISILLAAVAKFVPSPERTL